MQRNSINKVILVGHIGNKPEGRYLSSGIATATFSLATNESWKDSDQVRKDKTEWHNIVAWGKLADFASDYIQKGQLVYIEGKLQTRTWKDRDENSRKTTEIVASSITPLEWKNASADEGSKQDSGEAREDEPNGDDLPF